MITNTMSAILLDIQDIENIVYYDETSPSCLRWKIYKGSRAPKDGVAGSQRKDGYWVVRINNQLYLVHRIVWAIYNKTKELEANLVINHIDNNPSNNNISNLEKCSRMHNQNNSKMQTGKGLRAGNTSGINGINEVTTYNGSKYVNVLLNINGVRHQKSFSYLKLGKERAWTKAILYKESLYA